MNPIPKHRSSLNATHHAMKRGRDPETVNDDHLPFYAWPILALAVIVILFADWLQTRRDGEHPTKV